VTIMAAFKSCCTCGVVKALEEFNKRAASHDGHMPVCRDCSKAYNKRWYQEHTAAKKADVRARRKKKPLAQRRKLQAEYREAHREYLREYQRNRRAALKAKGVSNGNA
jgi:ribosome-binding protein aMBF1 (putative translation factor)